MRDLSDVTLRFATKVEESWDCGGELQVAE